ncbi:MAG: helix-turn-helix transcriptional regulator [Phycisphaerales bacterium]|nr:helix-turn-helix transcriptional regulator [Phycisphaerales bacterium]
MTDSGVQARLKIVVGSRSMREIAEITGVHQESARRYMRGSTPSLGFLEKLAGGLGVNLHWLVSGEGPMYAATSASRLAGAGPDELGPLVEQLLARVEALENMVDRLQDRLDEQDRRLGIPTHHRPRLSGAHEHASPHRADGSGEGRGPGGTIDA